MSPSTYVALTFALCVCMAKYCSSICVHLKACNLFSKILILFQHICIPLFQFLYPHPHLSFIILLQFHPIRTITSAASMKVTVKFKVPTYTCKYAHMMQVQMLSVLTVNVGSKYCVSNTKTTRGQINTPLNK